MKILLILLATIGLGACDQEPIRVGRWPIKQVPMKGDVIDMIQVGSDLHISKGSTDVWLIWFEDGQMKTFKLPKNTVINAP